MTRYLLFPVTSYKIRMENFAKEELHMDEHKRHVRAFSFFRLFASPLLRRKFNFTYEPIPASAAPYFLLCNHNLEMDPILLGIAAQQQTYFVASEHIMRKGLGTWFLLRYFKPIIHAKGKAGLQSSMEILRTLKNGYNVALFPEGNRSFNGVTAPIFPATGKLARRSGASLVTYRIEGGYFSQPRWSLSLRRGKLHGKLVHVYTPEELKSMTDAEIIAAIERDLHEDAYETQKRERVAFKGHDLAAGLESTLFTCPQCGKIGTLHSHGNTIDCTCGFRAVYDEYGDLSGNDGKSYTVTGWDLWQQEQLAALRETAGKDAPLFSDDVTVHQIEGHAIQKTFTAKLTACRDGFTVNDTVITTGEIEGCAIFSRNVLTAYYQNVQYEIRGTLDFCALKYLYLFNLMKGE